MRKMYAGLLILALTLGAALYNVHYLDRKMAQLIQYVDTAGTLADSGNFDSATLLLREALDYWTAMDSYTHVFIRHSEIDGALDAFYDCLGTLQEEEADYAAAIEKLRTHLSEIVTMEHLSLGSIF